MTPENIVGVVFIGILVLAFVGVALKERVQQKHVFLNKLRREWGNAPSGEWTVEELESIPIIPGEEKRAVLKWTISPGMIWIWTACFCR